jgi:hypothetical protein
MFQIANEPHPSPRDYNPNIPDCCLKIVDKTLMKEAVKRYQRGNELFEDIRGALGLLG